MPFYFLINYAGNYRLKPGYYIDVVMWFASFTKQLQTVYFPDITKVKS